MPKKSYLYKYIKILSFFLGGGGREPTFKKEKITHIFEYTYLKFFGDPAQMSLRHCSYYNMVPL